MPNEVVFPIDRESQTALNEAFTKIEFFTLYREYIITQIMLKNKEKNLRFDPTSKLFYETIPQEGEPNVTPIK